MARLHSALGDRTVYTIAGIAKAQGFAAKVYEDPAGTILASLAVYDPTNAAVPGAVIPGAALVVDAFSNRPAFWDLNDRDVLYITVAGGPLEPIRPDAQPQLTAHAALTAGVHGIPDTSVLETQAGAQSKVSAAQTAAATDATTKANTAQAAAISTARTALRDSGAVAGLGMRLDPDYATAMRVATPQTFPTGFAGNDVVEPKVVYFPDGCPVGMDGKRYVMLACPYPNSDATQENPSLWVSDDGNTWTVPSGVTNPLFPSGVGGAGYGNNSDGDLVLGPDNVWYLIWNQFGPGANNWLVRLSTSTNGVNWTAPVTVYATPIATQRTTCPSIIYDPVRQLWVMYAIDIVPAARTLIAFTAATPAGPWTQANPTYTWPATGRSPWHLNALLVGDQHVLLIDDTLNGSSGPGHLYLAVSNDRGASFTVGKMPCLRASGGTNWDAGIYRSTMVPIQHGDGIAFDLWYGGNQANTWGLGRTLLTFDRQRHGNGVTSKLKTGRALYYTSPLAPVSVVMANGVLRCAPFYVDRPVTLDRIGLEVVTVGDAGAVVRLGVYADDGDGYPRDLILDAGTVPAGATGWQEAAIGLSLPPGMYWLAAVTQNVTTTAPAVRSHQGQSVSGLPGIGSTTPLTLSANAGIGYQATGQVGALPGVFPGSPPGLSASCHRVCVRVA